MTITAPVSPAPCITVAHLITGLDVGGAECMLTKVVKTSDSTQFRHVVISLKDRGFWGSRIEDSGIELYTLKMTSPWSVPFALLRLYRLLKQIKPNILQTWLYHADFLGTLVWLALPIPTLIWNFRCSNMDLKRYPFHTRIIFKALSLLSSIPDGIAINSNIGLTHHQNSGFHPRNWFFIPNGFDTSQFAPNEDMRRVIRDELKLPMSSRLICFPARFDAMKDHATFLGAAQIIAQEQDDVFFILVGRRINDQNQPLADMIRETALQSRALLLGERTDMDRLLPAIDVVGISSAFGEGFPNVLGESMACGIPCVATDVGDIREIIKQTGIVVPPRAPEELAAAWRKILSMSPNEISTLGMMARNRIKEKYSIETVMTMYEDMYAKLSASPHSQPPPCMISTKKIARRALNACSHLFFRSNKHR